MSTKKQPKKVGRPTVMTPEVLELLRQAYLVGATTVEAAGFADISFNVLYEYIKKHPDFSQQIEIWRNKPLLKAKTTLVNDLGDIKTAQWYIERKQKQEFSLRQELTGKDGEALPTPILGGTTQKDVKSAQQVKDDE